VSSADYIATARDVFNLSAQTYVDFVGTELSPATEGPIDCSLLEAFVELLGRQDVKLVADLGCGPGRVAKFLASRGLDVIGVDVSEALLSIARTAHPSIDFRLGQLDALPIEAGVLAGAVCWYSIIFTPLERLGESFVELARVLIPGGFVLLAFQSVGTPVHRQGALGTHLSLTSYRHGVQEVADRLTDAGLEIYATVLRAPDLRHETTSQGFVIAARPPG
jgi:ubiquinone/menaquinone biosynthesis C-methylase UbiE